MLLPNYIRRVTEFLLKVNPGLEDAVLKTRGNEQRREYLVFDLTRILVDKRGTIRTLVVSEEDERTIIDMQELAKEVITYIGRRPIANWNTGVLSALH